MEVNGEYNLRDQVPLATTKVSSLLTNNRKRWNENMLNDLFQAQDKDLILNIPLSTKHIPDRRYWKWEGKGNFTVRSCYRNLVGETQNLDDKDWTAMWKSYILPKVKNFFWRACNMVLPTDDILHIKRVPCSRTCVLCGIELESIFHVFIDCLVIRSCWNILNIGVEVDGFVSFPDWVCPHMKILSKDNICLLIMLCWSIWNAKNDKLWNNMYANPWAITEKARSLLENWREAQAGKKQSTHDAQSHEIKWRKPPTGWIKINIDAAVDQNRKKMGMGCVIRNEEGEFVGAHSMERDLST